ncbi:hypothetical protein C8Q78DRAFT_1139180 [Trametes maxima]|nr:hypothetical protein C8Q78DRAFT_1139180 [Trametes maxima]
MTPSTNNRRSFLSIHLPPLSRSLPNSPPYHQDSAASQSNRSLQSFVSSPSRAAFLSPRSTLGVPASLHLKQEQPVLPIPLTDGLDPSEKMKLLRKTRKLSRILGEVPIPVSVDSPAHASEYRFLGVVEEPSLTSASTSASSSPLRTPEDEPSGSLKRSATVSHNRQSQQSDIHRARSLASLRPSLSIPPAALTVHPTPISPIIFSWPEQNSIPPSPVSVITPSEEYAPSSAPLRRGSSISSRRDSSASSIFPAQKTPEQVLRARAAKLARQLGDNIPPEVLLRASSPQPRSPLASPSAVSFAEASMTVREPPKRASSARPTTGKNDRRRAPKRRLSLDLRAFVRVAEPPAPSPSLSDTDKYGTVLAQDRHGWAAMRKGSEPLPARPHDAGAQGLSADVALAPPHVEQDVEADSDWEDGDPQSLALQRQRALNVRRARKMLQMFGNEPPPALFQITNIPGGATDEGISVALSIAHRRVDSHATTPSVSATSHAASESRHELRDSVTATSDSGENLSPLVFDEPPSVPPSQPQSPQTVFAEVFAEGKELPPLPPLSPSQETGINIRPASPLSVPTLTSSSRYSLSAASASTVSVPTSHAPSVNSQSPLASPILSSFQTSTNPPPQTTMFLWGPAPAPTSSPLEAPPPSVLPEPACDVHPSDPRFRVRRIRAAKLSRFFGVGLNDIAGMLRPGASPLTGAGAGTGAADAPSSPPLREFRRSDSSDSIPSPTSTRASIPSPPPATGARPARPVTSAGLVGHPSVSISGEGDAQRPRKRTLSSGEGADAGVTIVRSKSVSSRAVGRRPQTQPATMQGSATATAATGERNRSNSQPEVLGQAQAHTRAFSTTVEVAAENKGPFGFFDARRAGRAKELDMHDVIRELRKIK